MKQLSIALLCGAFLFGLAHGGDEVAKKETTRESPELRPIEPFVKNALVWLVKAQHESGGWGAGSHAKQQIRDPRAVQTDPATTAFTVMALIRAGNTPTSGEYKDAVRHATEYLVKLVEIAPEKGPKITTLTGTQPQQKLGHLVDTSMTVQLLSRVLPMLPKEDALRARVDTALDKCLTKLENSQATDGSWAGGGGWAPVLQSSLGCSALELALVAGKNVDGAKLALARSYQRGNFDAKTGKVKADKAAGIDLYAFAGSSRGGAGQARAANEIVNKAKREGKVAEDAEVSKETLEAAGVSTNAAIGLAGAATASRKQIARLDDEKMLAGFGNNGGEEYLSYMMTSESLIITGDKKFKDWNDKMHQRLKKIQSKDGSWTGHHCITSPVFCTAAVVQCLTTDRDAAVLVKISTKEEASATAAKK
ncbi:MAG: hypothetical protein O7E54_11230 [Planctomycetota bacterium]|nr:hypothetical protein [Planctomycetota bacterium]